MIAVLACQTRPEVTPPAAPEPPVPPAWPEEAAPLWRLAPLVHTRSRPIRLMLDPGHGAPGNDGNTGVNCQREAMEMLRISTHVQARLANSDAFQIRTTRPAGAVVDYTTRIRAADGWADLLVSFHSDARAGVVLGPHPRTGCPASDGAHGFSVLWSDEGPPPLVAARQRLARHLALALIEAGFPPYGGEDYTGLYEGDPLYPGTFVDRHEPDQRIRMLRRPEVPSVIVETHNAPDEREVARWGETRTLDAFADAVRVGVDRTLAAVDPLPAFR